LLAGKLYTIVNLFLAPPINPYRHTVQELATTQSAAGTFDAVVSLSAFAKAHSVQTVGQLLALAKPGASVTLQEPVSSSPTQVCIALLYACSTLL